MATTSAWASEGAGVQGTLRFWNLAFSDEIINKKRLFSYFREGNMNFHHFWPPGKKFWLPLEKSTIDPHYGKNPSDAHARQQRSCRQNQKRNPKLWWHHIFETLLWEKPERDFP